MSDKDAPLSLPGGDLSALSGYDLPQYDLFYYDLTSHTVTLRNVTALVRPGERRHARYGLDGPKLKESKVS